MSWFRDLFKGRAEPLPPSNSNSFPSEPEQDWKEYPDQAVRKERSERILKAEGIRINPHLPMIESEEEVQPRTAKEIGDRLTALVVVAFKASEKPDQDLVQSIVADRALGDVLTPSEREFIDDPDPDNRSRIQISWKCEAAWPLLWALNHVEGQLGLPRDTCDVPFLSGTVFDAAGLTTRGVRAISEILDEADLIYRCHWEVRQAGLDGMEPTGALHPGVTMERHHALNWLVRYNENADWDEVTTDT